MLSAFRLLPSSFLNRHSAFVNRQLAIPPPPLLRRYPHYCENSSSHGRGPGLFGSFCFNQLRRIKETFSFEVGLDHQLLTLFNQGRPVESFTIK